MPASIYPDDVVKRVLAGLGALDVLDFIDYRPDSFVRERGKVRCYCPIHRETMFRTLSVDEAAKTFRCSKDECPGTEGGDIVALAAWALRTDYDTVLRRLVEEFGVDVALPENQEAFNAALVEADNFVSLAATSTTNRDEHGSEARERLDRILSEDPEHLQALRLLKRLLDTEDPKGELAGAVARLADAELKIGNRDACSRMLQKHLSKHENDFALRRRLADIFAEDGERDRALEQFMMVADLAEVAGKYEFAIEAYRRIETLGETGIDAGSVISQLLVLLDKNKEAARELSDRARQHRRRGEVDQAEELLVQALEIDPQHVASAKELLGIQVDRGIAREEFMAAMRRIDGLMERAQWRDAVEALQTLADAMPEDTNVIERLFACHRATKSTTLARAMQERLVTLYLRDGDRGAARTILDEMLVVQPDNKDALRQYGELALLDRDNESAITHFRTLAQLCERRGDMDAAVDAYRQMVAAAPDSTRIVFEHVDLLKRLDRRPEAVAALASAMEVLRGERNLLGLKDVLVEGLRIAPEHPDFLLACAWTLDELGESDKAMEKRLAGCRALIHAGQASSAEEELKRVLEKHPKLTGAKELLADALAARGKKDDAAHELSELADLLSETKRFLRCREVLERLVALDPFDVGALGRLADACEASGDAEAIVAARARLVHVHRAKRRYPEGVEHVRRILDLRPDDAGMHRELVELLKLAGDADGWARAARTLARLHEERGELDAERAILSDIVRQRPRDFEARERLLDVLRTGDGASEDLMLAIDEYVSLCEGEGEIERAADFLQDFRTRATGSTVFSRRLVDLFQKASRTEQQEEELLALVRRHEQRGDVAELVPLHRELLKLKPSEVSTHRRLVSTLESLGRKDEAADAAAALAELHVHHHRHEEAEEVFREVFEMDPANERAWRGLAAMHAGRGNADEASAALRELAMLKAGRDEFAEAESVLREAFAIEPGSPLVQREIANLFLHPRRRDVDRAVKELETLSEFHATCGAEDAAVAARREAIELRPADVGLRRRLVNFLMERGRRAAAIEELVAVAETNLAAGAHEEAFLITDECIALSSGNVAVRALRARILEEAGDPAGALREWRDLAPMLAQRPDTPFDAARGAHPVPLKLNVLRDYDFDHFVVGEHNRFAHATALAVAKAPGRTPHNPLFLHSDVGLGKTHILHSIANAIGQHSPDARLIYTNAEDFTSELVDAIASNALAAFRAKYKSVDALLIDDVHFLAGKETAQEEFFHIFNTLFQARRQIVVTSDRPPRDIAHLEKRLKSRFGAGVIVDIQVPDLETRLAILRRDAAGRPDLRIPDDMLALIAERIETNVRELKAALNQTLLHHEIGGEPLDRDTADRMLKKLLATA